MEKNICLQHVKNPSCEKYDVRRSCNQLSDDMSKGTKFEIERACDLSITKKPDETVLHHYPLHDEENNKFIPDFIIIGENYVKIADAKNKKILTRRDYRQMDNYKRISNASEGIYYVKEDTYISSPLFRDILDNNDIINRIKEDPINL